MDPDPNPKQVPAWEHLLEACYNNVNNVNSNGDCKLINGNGARNGSGGGDAQPRR